MITNIVMNRVMVYENAGQGFSLKRLWDAVYDARFALLVPFIIMGGIYSDFFTPTKAAAVPYVFAMVFVVFLLAFVPQLSLWART